MIPCQFCTFTISTIVGSAILYRDFQRMEASTIFLFIFGCLLTFLGVWITSTRGSYIDQNTSSTRTTVSTGQRISRTISTVFSEQTPLIEEVVPYARPRSRRLQSSNAQTGPLINYFIAKAEHNRNRGTNQDAAHSYQSGEHDSCRVSSRSMALQSSSV